MAGGSWRGNVCGRDICVAGGMYDGAFLAGSAWRGACMVGACAWQWGIHCREEGVCVAEAGGYMAGGVHGRGCVWQGCA